MKYFPFNLSLDGIDVDHVDNLPTKCADDIKDIKSNIEIWLYLAIFVILLIFNFFLCIFSKKKLFQN